uniref:Putative aquaporin 3 n=1 Tax=Trypanosoma congolense (strain IL3000) TaxID=1068625 RepID=G0UYF6_TRYCI|nr:putative aquaporin 3 [Trypanosoma congolense IL3000]
MTSPTVPNPMSTVPMTEMTEANGTTNPPIPDAGERTAVNFDTEQCKTKEILAGEGEAPHGPMDINYWPLRNLRMDFREYVGEFLGTFVLLFMGNGVVATTLLDNNLGFLSITFGWGIAVTMGLYVSLGTSSGHLNPAVTVANAFFGGFPWKKVPGYIAMQMLGAFVGAACAYGVYADLLNKKVSDGEIEDYAGMFSTYPRDGNSLFSCIFGEFICTAMLTFCVCGIFDTHNAPATGHEPLAVGALVFAIGNNVGYATGYAINPARDFGPRVFSAILYGSTVFTRGDYYFWVPLFIPLLGGIFGIILYKYFVPH